MIATLAAAAAQTRDPRFALGQSIGLTAFVWGYPLVESMRTCRLQTLPGEADRVSWSGQIDKLHHVRRAATAADRDVITPANDLLYTTSWINLANGPRLLHVPSPAKHEDRYFVLALYDAWTNNFSNPSTRTTDPAGEMVVLLGPGTPVDIAFPSNARIIRSTTDLVWLIGRVLVGSEEDLPAAQALQSDIRLECPAGTQGGFHPAAVSHWLGAPQDTMAALEDRPHQAGAIAGEFFTNLCQCLADAPSTGDDAGIAAWFRRGKLVPGKVFDWTLLDAPLREGLQQGLQDGAALVLAGSRSHTARPWAVHFGLGRYGTDYLLRALTAYKGLGSLASDEAVYAMGDFDNEKQPLNGDNNYVMRFEAADLPPVDAFWSVTLYAADRFLFPNEIERHSIGDRTRGLQHDPDGGLTLCIGNDRPPDISNWLPAPKGSFYLMLRMYWPRPDARTWRIPPLRRRVRCG